jgi:conjugative transfer signal peptidase TraF
MHRAFAIIAALGALAEVAGSSRPVLVWNASASVPIGLYSVHPPIIRNGALTLVKPSQQVASFAAERGYLAPHVPLIKYIAAGPGDTVCRIGLAISIDGSVAAMSLRTDSAKRPLPTWSNCRTLRPRELFLLNRGAPDSFDSRYFGPIAASQVIGSLEPIWVR